MANLMPVLATMETAVLLLKIALVGVMGYAVWIACVINAEEKRDRYE